MQLFMTAVATLKLHIILRVIVLHQHSSYNLHQFKTPIYKYFFNLHNNSNPLFEPQNELKFIFPQNQAKIITTHKPFSISIVFNEQYKQHKQKNTVQCH